MILWFVCRGAEHTCLILIRDWVKIGLHTGRNIMTGWCRCTYVYVKNKAKV